MRMTVDLPEALLTRAKHLANQRGTTVSALIEEGLRRVLDEQRARAYRMPDASFGQGGLVEGLDPKRICELAYE